MLQVLPEQATQVDSLVIGLRDLQFHLVLSRITLHSLAAVVTAGCAVLLIRTASGTLHSRFLRHLAFSVSLNVIFRLSNVVVYLLKAGLAFLIAGHEDNVKGQVAENVARTLTTLETTWHGIDITISLLGSWFLVTTWHLLRRYPDEGVDRSLYSTLTAVFGTGVIGVLSFLLNLGEWIQKHLWAVLDVMDIAGATVGLLLVGWQLYKTLGRCTKIRNRVLQATLPWATLFAYFIWGGVQPLYPWLKTSSWYSNLLLISGVIAIIMTIVLCSQSLEEKPEYHSAGNRQSGRPVESPPALKSQCQIR